MAHISFDESIQLLNNLEIKSRTKKVFIEDALGYVLAEDVIAKYNNPYMPTASMDGYAIKHSDIDKEIKIIGSNPAGSFEFDTLNENEAIKTFTGSFMPKGADTLVPIENVDVNGDILKVHTKVNKGFSVREIGEDFKEGEIIIPKNTKITFAEIGVMASLNIIKIDVYDKAKIGIIATGSEILDLGEEGGFGQIRSSNNYTLSSVAKFYGFEATNYGLIKDNKENIKNKILEALMVNDIVVTTGGVSVGDYDFVKEVAGSFEVIFHGVYIKPGQWIMIAKAGDKYIVSLPGFPYSSFVTFLLYVLPLANKISKFKPLTKIKAKLRDDFKKINPKTQFIAVNISYENNEFIVDMRNKKSGSSGILTNIVNNFALIELEAGFYELKAGDYVDTIIYNKEFL